MEVCNPYSSTAFDEIISITYLYFRNTGYERVDFKLFG